MGKEIVVKGVGSASAKPDYVVIGLDLNTLNKDYQSALDESARKLDEIYNALYKIGFEKENVKTTNFNVQTRYDSKRDSHGNYNRYFVGYSVIHNLKISFDFDTKQLGKVLATVADCVAKPEMRINFTVKDPTAVSEQLLISATENAKRKAEILCQASNVRLGGIKHIDYNWGEINFYSNTSYTLDEECEMRCASIAEIDIEPDDINLRDTVTFIWEIED